MKHHKIEIFLGRFFMVLISVILIFVVLDRGTIPYLSHRSPIEQQFPTQHTRAPKPYVMFGGVPNAEDLNHLGYRGKAPSLPKPADEYRIFMLGGSTVFQGDPPLPELLEQEFHKHGALFVKVFNFGVISSVSSMELSRIIFEISDLEPDLIIMYNGGNDILSPFAWDPRPGYPLNFVVYENNPLLEKDIRTYPTWTLFAYGSNILRSLFPGYFIKQFVDYEGLGEKHKRKSEEWKNQIAEIYVNNVKKADKIAFAFNSEFIAFFQPMIYYKKVLTEKEKRHAKNMALKEHAIDIRKRILQGVQEIQNKETLKIVDLSDIFYNESQQVFVDLIHLEQEKRNVIAQEIYKHLMEFLKGPLDLKLKGAS